MLGSGDGAYVPGAGGFSMTIGSGVRHGVRYATSSAGALATGALDAVVQVGRGGVADAESAAVGGRHVGDARWAQSMARLAAARQTEVSVARRRRSHVRSA